MLTNIAVCTEIRRQWQAGRPLLLYGAGGAGRDVRRFLDTQDIKVQAFIDAAARAGDVRDNIPVFTLADWLRTGHAKDTDILVSIHNHIVPVEPILKTLRQEGFGRVFNMVEYLAMFPDHPPQPNWLWLVPPKYFFDKSEKIARVRALMADEFSREWFDATVALRINGDYACLPEPVTVDEYMPSDLPVWCSPLRLIDCGAYDGDSINAFLGHGYEIEAVAAFEPDPASYETLSKRFSGINLSVFPYVVGAVSGEVRFNDGQGWSSRSSEDGPLLVCQRTIDETLPNFAPNLVKMDIEGAELAALKGAQVTLRRHRPGLAISVYHEPDDFLEIPLWLSSLDIGFICAAIIKADMASCYTLWPIDNRTFFHGLKFIRSLSITSGRLVTWVRITPIYSPRMPMKKSWTEAKKNRAMRMGAVLAGKWFQNSSFAMR